MNETENLRSNGRRRKHEGRRRNHDKKDGESARKGGRERRSREEWPMEGVVLGGSKRRSQRSLGKGSYKDKKR